MDENKGGHDHAAAHETPWHRTKRITKRVWHFLWVEDSVASWIANIIVAFLLIKFIVYPVLGAVLGTTYPIVAVVSGSMEHDASFNDWWIDVCAPGGRPLTFADGTSVTPERLYGTFDIDQGAFEAYPFHNGFDKGDLMILYSGQSVRVGDVLVFATAGLSDPVIHRIVDIRQDGQDSPRYYTMGDHNCRQHPFEQGITQQQVLGKAVVRIPWLGWIKIGFVELIQFIRSIIIGR